MIVSASVLVCCCAGFIGYELFTFKRVAVQQLSTDADIIAFNVTPAMLFNDPAAAADTLAGLRASPTIAAAAVYTSDGRLFAKYGSDPRRQSPNLPDRLQMTGSSNRIEGNALIVLRRIVSDGKPIGMIYIRSNFSEIPRRLRSYALIVFGVLVASFALALAVSSALQKKIAAPLLALSDTARTIASKHDYSVRALTRSSDEIGTLGAAFNEMLQQIEEQNATLQKAEAAVREVNTDLERRVLERTEKLTIANAELAKAEEGLRRFFTVSLEMLAIAGFDGYFKRLNPAWETVLGYPLQELYDRPFLDFVHPDDREVTTAEAARLADGNLTVHFENRYRCADGSYRWLLWNAVGLPEEEKIFAAASDITERKQLESTLQDRATALEHANRELESFSYSVSHDLRSPLRAVDGYARIFEEDYASSVDDEGRRLLSVIRGEARRMGVLIDDLLAFSQVGRRSLSANEVDLGRMAGDIIAEKRRRYPDRQINFVAREAPLAFADSNAIRHVVFNLIANAVKYSKPEAAVDIEFGGRADGDHNLYWVADHGIGFDMRYADKIFGVFQRLHTNDRIEGSGVGLAIVQRVVERHGGRVWAESEIGKGTTFFFTLPFAQNKIENTEIANERSGNPAGRG